jgi:hypothetical protein
VVWRSFVQAGVRGVRVLLILDGFFSAKYGSSTSARFLIYRAHTVCFLLLVTILDHFLILSVYSNVNPSIFGRNEVRQFHGPKSVNPIE